MSSTALREATPADARGIAVVHVASWRAAYKGLMADKILDGLSVDRRELNWFAELSDPRELSGCAVAEKDAAIVGFASWGVPEDPDDRSADETGELHAIYLAPQVWGQGIGRQLMERAVEGLRAAGFSQAVLWVVEGNERSRRFYDLAGWSLDGGRKTECMPGIEAPAVRYRITL
jgi:GNAT superfamily N-acetyltransferase